MVRRRRSAASRSACATCPRPLGGAIAAALLPLAADAGGVEAALLALCGGVPGRGRGRRRRPAPARSPSAGELDEPPPHLTSAGPLRDRAIWRLSLGTAAVVLGQISVLSFLALYLHEQRGWSVTASALALAGGPDRRRGGAGRGRARGPTASGSRIRPLRAIALAGGVTLGVATALLAGARRGWPCRC